MQAAPALRNDAAKPGERLASNYNTVMNSPESGVLDIGRVQLARGEGSWRVSAMIEGDEVYFASAVPLRPSAEAFGMLEQFDGFGKGDLPARIEALPFIPLHLDGQWGEARRALGATPAAIRALRRRSRRHAIGERVRGALGAIRTGMGRMLGVRREG